MNNKVIKIIYLFLLPIPIISQNLLLNDLSNKLIKHGINFELAYTGEVFSNIAGGNNKNSVYLDNFSFQSEFDLKAIFGWNGAIFKVFVLGNQGCDPAEFSGSMQGTSSIAAHNTWKLYELWFSQDLFNDKFNLLFGLFDLNSEFDTRETSGLFINPSHGIGAEFAFSGENGPSIFPTTSLAFRLRYNLSSAINIKASVLDGIPGDPGDPNGTKIMFDDKDGVLLVSEFNYHSKDRELKSGYFNYGIGVWYYSSQFQLVGGSAYHKNKGNIGMYFSAEKFLFQECDSKLQGLSAFVRTGIAASKYNPIDKYFGAGITYLGLFDGREEDVLGIALAAAHCSPNFKSQLIEQFPEKNIKDIEYIIELTYNYKVFEFFKIQPDIQYVINPFSSHNNSSLQVGLRTTLIF